MISVEANIGAGKSTFLKILGEKWPDVFNVIYEPLDDWLHKYRDVDNSILGLFYEDQKRWTSTFQMNAFITRIQKYESEKKTDKINLTERSILSDNKLFAKSLKDDGKMNEIEWKLYENWFNWLSNKFNSKPESIIYLRCDPEVSYQRVKKRSRNEEDTITLDYLKTLHKCHDDWLLNEKEIPVKIIDVNTDFENDQEKIQNMFNIITQS